MNDGCRNQNHTWMSKVFANTKKEGLQFISGKQLKSKVSFNTSERQTKIWLIVCKTGNDILYCTGGKSVCDQVNQVDDMEDLDEEEMLMRAIAMSVEEDGEEKDELGPVKGKLLI